MHGSCWYWPCGSASSNYSAIGERCRRSSCADGRFHQLHLDPVTARPVGCPLTGGCGRRPGTASPRPAWLASRLHRQLGALCSPAQTRRAQPPRGPRRQRRPASACSSPAALAARMTRLQRRRLCRRSSATVTYRVRAGRPVSTTPSTGGAGGDGSQRAIAGRGAKRTPRAARACACPTATLRSPGALAPAPRHGHDAGPCSAGPRHRNPATTASTCHRATADCPPGAPTLSHLIVELAARHLRRRVGIQRLRAAHCALSARPGHAMPSTGC